MRPAARSVTEHRVAGLTGDILDGRPRDMWLIVRKERPHPGAQLRITDAQGMRVTCFATDTADRGSLLGVSWCAGLAP